MNFLKKAGKQVLCRILERQARRLRQKHKFHVVAVVGSVGKTSTKLAIASVLSASKKVRHQEGNYNDRLTVPLVLFGHTNPSIFNIFAWGRIIISNQIQTMKTFPFDVVVLELGTDGPGQIMEFAYLKPEIAVVSAVTPEHMEFFKTLDAVAKEELSVSGFAEQTFINTDDVPSENLAELKDYYSYGFSPGADYCISSLSQEDDGRQQIMISSAKFKQLKLNTKLLGKQGAKIAAASAIVALELGMEAEIVAQAVLGLSAFSGRMNLLRGVKGSMIIDDTYNSSPAAVYAGLEVLYSMNATQKIAILGTMNELGETSEALHKQIGLYCDPTKLDLLVTIGNDAEQYTATAAQERGCRVKSFDSPYDAGDYIRNAIKEGGAILAKGSQNRVFAEESLKVLLANPDDSSQLVRQSKYWLKIKESQFGRRN